jgi:hypothetical protein
MATPRNASISQNRPARRAERVIVVSFCTVVEEVIAALELGIEVGAQPVVKSTTLSPSCRTAGAHRNMESVPHHEPVAVNRLAIKLGFWSAILIIATFAVFTMAFIAIPLTGPLFVWNSLEDYLAYVRNGNTFFQELARWMMLLFGPLIVILFASIYELSTGERRLLVRIGLSFAVIFAALTSINYFVQLTAVRIAIQKDIIVGLEQIVQANPISAIAAINVLGWSVFFGLASLFVAPLFTGSRLQRFIGICFILNGTMCLLGGIGYVLDNGVLVFFALNFGMGGAVFGFAIGLALFFHRLDRQGSAGQRAP